MMPQKRLWQPTNFVEGWTESEEQFAAMRDAQTLVLEEGSAGDIQKKYAVMMDAPAKSTVEISVLGTMAGIKDTAQ